MRKAKYFVFLLIITLLCGFFAPCTYATENSNVSNEFNNSLNDSNLGVNNSDVTNSSSINSAVNSSITTYSPACILIEANSGKVLYEKNSNKVKYPASTTKIMTAILTMENCELTDIATVSHNALFSVPASYVTADLKEGEQLTIEQLLNVLLIPSANDAAFVLAEHIGGTVENFANMMNEKAKEIGCLNTHFVNPNGIHNKNHTTTAYDLALMGKYAMQFDKIREIVKKTRYTLPATNKYDKADRIFKTSNELIEVNNSKAKDNYYYENAIGIKTGYTSEAGSCIIAGAKKDNLEVIVVVLGGQSTKDGLSQRYLDCINLFNYAFENYKVETVQEKNSVLQQIFIPGATKDTKNLNVIVKDEISIFMENNSEEEYKPEIVFNDKLMAPISANSVIGKITYRVGDDVYSSDLLAQTSVIASGFWSILIRIVLIFVTLYIIFLLLRKPKNKTRNKSKNRTMSKTNTRTKNKKSRGYKEKHSKSSGSGKFRFTAISNFKE